MYVCVRAYVCVCVGGGAGVCMCVGGNGCVWWGGRCMREGAVRLINRSLLYKYYYVLKNIYLLFYYATLIFVILPIDKM